MEAIWSKLDELRADYPILANDRLPIDVFAFVKLDLRLDTIPFPALNRKYRVEAAITADFTGNYLDEEEYNLMELGRDLSGN